MPAIADSMNELRKPKQASTVILLRQTAASDFEAFLTRRPEGMRFLGGMYCFPGGTTDQHDCSPRVIQRCAGVTAKQARQILGAHLRPADAIALWVTAARELFEEVGVLLAVESNGEPLRLDPARRARLQRYHAALSAHQLTFVELLEAEGLRCDLGRLCHFSHWQTPAQVAMRFDTRFFVSMLPEDQTPLTTSYEVADSVWITPDRALQMFGRGELPMIFPTFAALRTLADFSTVDSVFGEFQAPSARQR
jgi:8-oxo-dGTP pyrophosphatase MutT (NUDIX family)